MDLLISIFHFTMMAFGAVIRLDTVKYPNLMMLINRIAFVAILIYAMI